MKTKKEIEAELHKFDDDAIGKHDYGNMMPLSEWARYSDLGYKKALEWVLDLVPPEGEES